MCLLLISCGKPIEDSSGLPESPTYEVKFELQSVRSFGPEYSNIGSITLDNDWGWYTIPRVVRSYASGSTPQWVYLSHDNQRYCYERTGREFVYSHKTSGNCRETVGRVVGLRSFFIFQRKPVTLDMDECKRCEVVSIHTTIVKE